MSRYVVYFVSIVIMSALWGCGNQGDPGNGNTVYMQASLTPNTTGVATANVFSNMSGSPFANMTTVASANMLSFTINSKIYPNANKIPVSDIIIDSISFTYTPQEYAPGKLSPSFVPTLSKLSYSGNLPAGGSLKIDNVPILWNNDLISIRNYVNANNIPTGTALQYKVGVTFHGIEVNTSTALSNSINVGAVVSVQ